MVNYRGYLIHFRSEVLSWRFMAAPASPELPILSRGVSRQFSSRDEALAELAAERLCSLSSLRESLEREVRLLWSSVSVC